MHEPSEKELDQWMARLAHGERSAFDPLFRALYPRAIRFARVRLGSELAADAAQSALERVFSRASEFTPGRPVLPWFYAVLANEVRAVSRRSSSRETRGDGDLVTEWNAEPQDPERSLLERELHHALEKAVASLDAPAAQAISALLGRAPPPVLTPAAFRKRISRAYTRLRLLLGGFDEE